MRITDEGALLVKVNRHKHGYNGDICIKPNTYECGANQWFRQNNCARGNGDCFDIRIFHESDPFLVKTVSDEVRPFFEKQSNLLAEGKNPIMFFFTNGRNRNDQSFPIVGAYIVKNIRLEKGFHKDDLYIYPKEIIKLQMDTLPNEYLYIRSTEIFSISWCREVYQSAVFPFLEIMANKLQEYGNGEFEASAQSILNIMEQSATKTYALVAVDQVTSPNTPVSMKTPNQERVSATEPNITDRNTLVIKELRERFDQEVNDVVATAAQSGFYYPRSQVASLHNSLSANPFLILSGISGGGKTSFALFYGKALNANIQVVSVRPDWTNPSHLLGFYDPFAKDFIPSETTRYINEAWQSCEQNSQNAPIHILLLDEMNLARVEYYFSDFLSKMQLQDPDQRVIRLYEENEGEYPRELRIPPNLRIIGTVNIDETTFLFSPKVLDRATYVFLNEIDIDGMGKVLNNRADDFHHLPLMTGLVLPELKVLNAKLSEFGNPFGYRTVWEIIRWIDSALAVGIIEDPYEGLDLQVESRVLSKISGIRRNGLFHGLRTYFQDRIDPNRGGRCIFDRSLTRLETLIERAEREDFAIGQQ